MMRRVVFRPQALLEYAESCDYYGAHDPEVRARFEARIERKLQSVVRNHELYPVVLDDVREATVDGFPFTIYFRVTDRAIRVLSVFHHSRDPAVCQLRAEDS